MNINNVSTPTEVPEDIWKAIFDKQWELAKKYEDIEDMGTLLFDLETNIDTANGQKWIKDFAWRVTEELTEAQEAIQLFTDAAEDKDYPLANTCLQHYVEELIDALHFLTELTLIAGYREEIIEDVWPDSDNTLGWENVVYYLGLMCNCLKNKPWKQTQMLTDRVKFKTYLDNAWFSLLSVLAQRVNKDQVYLYYFKKNAVNQFRIRSKY